jgi:hypothetical protein
MSINFGGHGSRSNISSIVHLEEVSAGYYSIERLEHRVQKKALGLPSKMQTSRSSNLLKDEPVMSRGAMPDIQALH